MVETVRSLYMRIPQKWRPRIILWIASFLFGLIVTLIWGAETLLVILIFLIFIAVLFRTFDFAKALKIERWLKAQFLGRVRWMVILAFLPAVWEVAKDLIENPSMSSAIALILVVFLIVVIWDRFEQILKGVVKARPSSSRRRRR